MRYVAENGPFRNTVLQRLSAAAVLRLDLRRVEFALKEDLETPGQPVERVVFLEEGVGSMTAVFQQGVEAEVSMFGYQSVVGASGLMGARCSLHRTYMQLPGFGYVTALRTALDEFDRREEFHRLLLRSVQAQLTQSLQISACNAVHSAEQRLARWLLICHDRSHDTDVFRLSHEFLADMLGSTRATVSLAAGALKQRGLIQYSRGLVQIPDPAALERYACECYRTVRDYLDDNTCFDTSGVR